MKNPHFDAVALLGVGVIERGDRAISLWSWSTLVRGSRRK